MKSLSFPFLLLLSCFLISTSCSRKTNAPTSDNTSTVSEKEEKRMAEKQEIMAVAVSSTDLEEEGLTPLRSMRDQDTVVSMRTTSCYGECPVYIATILSDGSVYYFGRKFVDKVGRYKAKVPYKKVREIDLKMQSIDILNKADHYPEDGKDILDVSSTILTVEFKGQRKEIYINHAAPVELNNFVTYLENFFKNMDWQPAGPKD